MTGLRVRPATRHDNAWIQWATLEAESSEIAGRVSQRWTTSRGLVRGKQSTTEGLVSDSMECAEPLVLIAELSDVPVGVLIMHSPEAQPATLPQSGRDLMLELLRHELPPPFSEVWEVAVLAVRPFARRRGIGTALLCGAQLIGRGDLQLIVRASNAAAKGCYSKAGFQFAGYCQAPIFGKSLGRNGLEHWRWKQPPVRPCPQCETCKEN